MKKFSCFFFIICLAMVMQLMAVPTLATNTSDSTSNQSVIVPQQGPAIAPQGQAMTVTDADASVTYGCNTLDGQVPLGGSAPMLQTARSAILYELNSGTILYAYNPDMTVQPASLAKIMMTLIVLENADLTEKVTATQTALDTVPGNCITLEIKAGETFSIKDLVYASMVGSANDTCAILAEVVAGSQEAFVAMMNERAAEIGCTGTNFTNPTGLPDEMQYTTARDLAKILEEALKNETFRDIFGRKNYWVDENDMHDGRYLVTGNYFISKESKVIKFYDTRVTGGRTGEISVDKRSMACTAESGDLSLLSIVMEAQGILEADGYSLHRMGNMEETADLLEWGFKYFSVNQVLNQGKSIAQFPVTNGENQIIVRPVETEFSAVPYGTTNDYITWIYHLDDGGLSAPVAADSRAGIVQLWYGSVCLAQSEIRTMNTSPVATNILGSSVPGDEIDNRSGLAIFLQGLGIAFAVVVIIVILFIALRVIRGALIRMRRRRRRQNRRRSR